MYPCRIFLSYCSEDEAYAKSLVDVLSRSGLIVFRDHKLTPGNPFTPEIKTTISRSHLFVVLLTRASKERPWVHQETGCEPTIPFVFGPCPLVSSTGHVHTDEPRAERGARSHARGAVPWGSLSRSSSSREIRDGSRRLSQLDCERQGEGTSSRESSRNARFEGLLEPYHRPGRRLA